MEGPGVVLGSGGFYQGTLLRLRMEKLISFVICYLSSGGAEGAG